MLVMKFGGASVKNAPAIRNVAQIITQYRTESPNTPLVIVVSAMDKTTNALEQLARLAAQQQADQARAQFQAIAQFHNSCAKELFGDSATIQQRLQEWLHQLERIIDGLLLLGDTPPRVFDRIMSYGEMLSSVMLHQYLVEQGLPATWLDARQYIVTDSQYKQAEILWDRTEDRILQQLPPLLTNTPIAVVQGYIAASTEGHTTTLGREGSDYTASIFGAVFNAQQVIIWKDVPGVMSGDPKVYSDAQIIPQLSYEEAVEMTYFGATVIHPKTIKPLQNRNIPLYVKPFMQPQSAGTCISQQAQERAFPIRTQRQQQVMIEIQPKSFNFMDEALMGEIMILLNQLGLECNLIQRTAIALVVVINENEEKLNEFRSWAAPRFDTQIRKQLWIQTLLHPPGAFPSEPKALLTQHFDNHSFFLLANS
jgi:aspartate kinase